ncbi:hypothetical protein EJ02DRAFT_99065 [Clathrospora elynae]|uniref:Uncharacterized protein n=1 Tax=Clathrospora elynae TaxID=706981 RepID=A0A6A5SUL6_9PLEO|nr:hypothetical protein EJ02DRAFT_99065 [Clathrospora elynae]
MPHVADSGHSAGSDSQHSSPLSPMSFSDSEREHESDRDSCATTVPEIVMAEQVSNDAVKEAQSVGRSAPTDASASTSSTPAVNGEVPAGPTTATSNARDAPSSTPIANGTDAASADSAHVSDKAGDSSDHSAAESHAVADASGGSDTDISRPGSVDPSKQDGSHVRTNSTVKRPSTFKAVSVTKSFLAKSTGPTPVARAGEKPAPVAQPKMSSVLTAKPRLVAKSGTGNVPRTLGKVNGAGSGPDASKVWNKNQPVPIPPPKQFTDEELKQQYGIHLATRLQADEGGKEAKWADIDDDEDDWAPDTVQWMDGTKSSVPAENQPPPVEAPKTILKPEAPAEAPKPAPPAATAAATPKPSLISGAKTILKPGVHAQPGSTKSSLVLKGQPEKPTLVAKPSATEKKSPWAPLPPMEKASPLQINPPPQQQPSHRFSQRDSYGYDPMPPPPAKEIAPDDFNRSWRNDSGAQNGRELFNSQSGRYEPVHNDVRRGSVRDAGFRQQPSLLQRPSHDGPAEPSAAFQTSRASADGPTWGRRRNSSNVSGGIPRRMSIDRRAPDMPTGPMSMERRESHSVNGFDPSDPGAHRQSPFAKAVSPNVAHAHPASPYGSVASPAVQDISTPVSAPPAVPAPPAEDPVDVQKRLMAEKIERARLKKLQDKEDEKKTEAERKERIALKLAALAPAEPKSKAKEQSPSRPDLSAQKAKAVPASVQSPPKPPVPTADGEVTQYGMMKVHQSHPVKKSPQSEHAQISKPAQQAQSKSGPSPTQTQADNEAKAPSSLNQQSAQPFGATTRENDRSRQSLEQSKNVAPQSEGSIPSGSKPQAPPAAWAPATAPRPWTSQVWGPPQARDRALGNGTFDSGYNRGHPRPGAPQQLPVQLPASTAPIGMGLASQTPALPSAGQLPPSQPMYSQRRPLPARPAAPSRSGRPVVPIVENGWADFGKLIKQDDAELISKHRQDRERHGEFRPEIRETFKDQVGQAQSTLHDKVAGNVAVPDSSIKKDDATKPLVDGPSPQQSLSQGTLQQTTGPRASRFFPRPTDATPRATTIDANGLSDADDADNSDDTNDSIRAESPPPPPETETHPAFSGDMGHPLVKLPKPSPVVRLPPSASGDGTVAAQVSMPARGQPLGARPLARNPEWQARFNKLLDKPGSTRGTSYVSPATTNLSFAPSKQGALAPAASSKATLDVRGSTGPATVSLPTAPQTKTFTGDRGREAVTRKGAEALFEDREFGSLPTVKLCKAPHLAANLPAKPPPKDEQNPRNKKFENPFTTRRLEAFDIEKAPQNVHKFDVVIRLANMRNPTTISVPRKRRGGPKPNGPFKPKHNGAQNVTPASGPKDRPRKPSQPGQGDRSNNPPRPSAPNAWSSNTRSSPANQATTWARRAAASVH